jgi:hypothetical protein
MFLHGVLVDAIPVNANRWNNPGYINHLKTELEDINEELLDLSKELPQFFIDEVPSRVNKDFPAQCN